MSVSVHCKLIVSVKTFQLKHFGSYGLPIYSIGIVIQL